MDINGVAQVACDWLTAGPEDKNRFGLLDAAACRELVVALAVLGPRGTLPAAIIVSRYQNSRAVNKQGGARSPAQAGSVMI